MTLACELDHLVVAARTLEQGTNWIESILGVEIGPGGAHPRMGTHNRLMKVAPGAFLEVIAIDPDAAPPASPRWYALDDPVIQASLETSPRLLTWVVRTRAIEPVAAASPIPPGEIVPASRGALHWHITVPADGSLPAGGVMPTIIQWPEDAEPWTAMANPGCRLEALTLSHPEPERIEAALAAIGVPASAMVSFRQDPQPGLAARFASPRGTVEIS
ncbi:MAG: VOC family protein [Methyloligellaceae bacterium]